MMSSVYKQNRVPSAEEYVSGLTAIASRMTDVQRRLLVAQYHAPYRSVTVKQLAQLAEVSGGWPTVNLQYGRLGRVFCEEIGFTLSNWWGGSPDWWSIFSLGYRTPEGFVWEMLPQVAEALESLGWVFPEESRIPEEVSSENLLEGSTRRIEINSYERNQIARRKCIEHYGSSCTVCEIDLRLVYGPIAQGYIHVHHIKPLSEVGVEYSVYPIQDLRPVCPNCHAIIHLGGHTRSIEEVRELVEHASANSQLDF